MGRISGYGSLSEYFYHAGRYYHGSRVRVEGRSVLELVRTGMLQSCLRRWEDASLPALAFQGLLCPSGRLPTGESPRRSGSHGASCSRHPRCHSALNWGCPARSSPGGGWGVLPPRPEHSPSPAARGREIRRGVVRRGRRAVPEGVGAQLGRSRRGKGRTLDPLKQCRAQDCLPARFSLQ